MFELFQKRNINQNIPHVSINFTLGQFRFNQASVKKYINNKPFVKILFDKEQLRIGFEFLFAHDTNCFSLHNIKGSTYLFCKSILNLLNIKLKQTTSFKLEEDNQIIYFNY
jgi:hypothetical protein